MAESLGRQNYGTEPGLKPTELPAHLSCSKTHSLHRLRQEAPHTTLPPHCPLQSLKETSTFFGPHELALCCCNTVSCPQSTSFQPHIPTVSPL